MPSARYHRAPRSLTTIRRRPCERAEFGQRLGRALWGGDRLCARVAGLRSVRRKQRSFGHSVRAAGCNGQPATGATGSSHTKSQRHESLQRAHRGWTWKSRGRSSRLVPFKQMPNGLASRRLVGGEKTKRQGATSAGTCARSSNPNLHQESKPNMRTHMRAAHCARRLALHQVPHGHESGSSLLSAADFRGWRARTLTEPIV